MTVLTHRTSALLFRRPRLRLALLLGLPLLWLGVFYAGSLLALLAQSFYALDDFTGVVKRSFTLDTWRQLFSLSNATVVMRTAGMATAVTIASAVVAFPLAYYMGRYASRTGKTILYLLVLVPLWSSYLVRVYSWKLILAKEGILSWFVERLGLGWLLEATLGLPVVGGFTLSTSLIGQFLVFTYIWLPFMVLPVATAVEKIPRSLLEASADLGARSPDTFRRVVLPLVWPGVVAGSIFTFSLTLGDYIIPTIIGDSSPFIGYAIYSHQGVSGNVPLAAAFSFIPIAIMAVYIFLARRTGAFENL